MENFTLIDFHQTRDFSRKMNVTFEFIRQNFLPLCKSILLIAGPPVVVASLFLGSFMNDFITASFNAGQGGDPDRFLELFTAPNFWLQIVFMVVFMILSLVVTLATINSYVLLYEQEKSNKISVNLVWDKVRDSFWMYLGTGVLYSIILLAFYLLMIFVGGLLTAFIAPVGVLFFIAAFVGLIYVAVACSLIFIIRHYEKQDFFGAVQRAFYLIRGKWWSTFGLTFVLSMIGGVLSYIFMIPWYAVTIVSSLHDVSQESFEAPTATMGVLGMVLFTLYYMTQMLLQSLPHLGIAFQYFNLVERKEARGLMNQLDTFGQGPSPSSNENEQY